MKKPLVIACCVIFTACGERKEWELASPDGNIVIQVGYGSEGDNIQYQISIRSDTGMNPVLLPSPLGIERADQQFVEGLTIKSGSSVSSIHEPYKLLHGKRRENPGHANQRTLRIQNSEGAKLDLELRAYNNGVAFRYVFPGEDAVLARRSGDDWYIGGINGEDKEKTVQFELSFLGRGRYKMLLMTDGEINRQVEAEERTIRPEEKLEISMAPFGGFVARITPIEGQ